MNNTSITLSPILLAVLQSIDPAELDKFLLEKFPNLSLNGEANNVIAKPVYEPYDDSIEAQIDRQLKAGKGQLTKEDFIGIWPGDETYEELLAKLTK